MSLAFSGTGDEHENAVAPHEVELAERRADRELAIKYLKAAMESLDNPHDRAGGLLALRTMAEAYGGCGDLDELSQSIPLRKGDAHQR